MKIKLIEYTNSNHPNGNVLGKEVFAKLCETVELHSSSDLIEVSLEGIEATDASFPRESIIALAKQYRCEKYFFLTEMRGDNPDTLDADLVENWSYGAAAKEQPMTIWNRDQYKIIGPKMTKATEQLVEYVLSKGEVTTNQVANDFELSIPNASTRLKKLYSSGYIIRTEEVAETGGREFVYKAIKKSG